MNMDILLFTLDRLPSKHTIHAQLERHWQKAGCKPQGTDN